ncbi:hypothetical protein LEMLEM_LOCUS5729 [Lemmus lemmus]
MTPRSLEGPLAPVLQEEVDDALLAHVDVVLDARQLGGEWRPASQLLGLRKSFLPVPRFGWVQGVQGLLCSPQAIGDGGSRLTGTDRHVVLLENGFPVRGRGGLKELAAQARGGRRALSAQFIRGAEVLYRDATFEDLACHSLPAPAERMRAAQTEWSRPRGCVWQRCQRLTSVCSQQFRQTQLISESCPSPEKLKAVLSLRKQESKGRVWKEEPGRRKKDQASRSWGGGGL